MVGAWGHRPTAPPFLYTTDYSYFNRLDAYEETNKLKYYIFKTKAIKDLQKK